MADELIRGHSRIPNLPFFLSWVSGKRAKTAKLLASTALLSLVTPVGAVIAQEAESPTIFGLKIETFDVLQFSLMTGALIAAMTAAIWMILERGRINSQNEELRSHSSALASRLTQLEILATADGQRSVIWAANSRKPEIIGDLASQTGAPEKRGEFLAFGRWLEPRSAMELERAINDLRDHAAPFSMVVETQRGGVPIDVIGRTAGGTAMVRFGDLTGERAAHARLTSEHRATCEELETFKALLETSANPAWLRDRASRLVWANAAYGQCIDLDNGSKNVEQGAELFGVQSSRMISEKLAKGEAFHDKLTTVVRGDRVIFDVTAAAGPAGSAGMAVDQTETDAVRTELNRTIQSHEETLDQLATAVAMFDENAGLRFHNQAFQKLWDLDTDFLRGRPNMSMFLDRMRTQGQLPEQPDWRRWKNEILAAFQSADAQEYWWHLPDRRTLRVFANPHPKGGLTWIFENLTEQFDLESRFITMERVQGETLDHLTEGVAVFGSDGTLQLANPAFNKFWGFETELIGKPVHISSFAKACAVRSDDSAELWSQFAGITTGFEDDRKDHSGRIVTGSHTLSWMVVPLPNGQTMITFVDITAADQIERALRDRNDALEQTEQLRNRFIKHVSHELRAPLTSIRGFTELLQIGTLGSLTDMQMDYVNHIAVSSDTLMHITNDILDLASIDAGMMELTYEKKAIGDIMHMAAQSVQSRFDEHNIELLVRVNDDAGSLVCDVNRLTQVFANLLSNAADFAPEGTTVTFNAKVDSGHVRFIVRDQGRGIDPEVQDTIFDRFQTADAGRTRGAGLGLAIVKSFVTLHDGVVSVESSDKSGTEFVIDLPLEPARMTVAAE